MPLYENAAALIRTNLEQLMAGERPKRVDVGELEDERFAEINQFRSENGLVMLTEKKLVFIGKHIYQRRLIVCYDRRSNNPYQLARLIAYCHCIKLQTVRKRWNFEGRIRRYVIDSS